MLESHIQNKRNIDRNDEYSEKNPIHSELIKLQIEREIRIRLIEEGFYLQKAKENLKNNIRKGK